MKLSATIANSFWVASSLPAWRRFRANLNRPAETQSRWLRGHLARNANCEFARRHGLANADNHEEFARRVPLMDYEQHEPWIERIRQGEQGLLSSEPVTHLIPTSGSTGARKLIPFTRELQNDFNRAIGPWICDLASQRPAILGGPAYWSLTPALHPQESEPSVVPVGFASDASYLGGAKGWLVRATLTAPDKVDALDDIETFRFATLRCLLQERELRLISVWHPSFLTLLLDALPRHWNRLLAVLPDAMPLRHADPHNPESIWPRLQMISCWCDGPAHTGAEDLRQRLPSVQLQPKGLVATEAFVTLPFGAGCPLAINSHFFEFLGADGRVVLADALRAGEEYEVVVTTAGGLWRYRLGDRVIVTDLVGKTPSLKFLGRQGNVSDRFGEKLSEAFVAQALEKTFASFGCLPRFALLAPDESTGNCRYTLYLEGTDASRAEMAVALDDALRDNPHYAYCRDLSQLSPPCVFVIESHGYERFVERQAARGSRLGGIKPAALSRLSGWSEVFGGVPVSRNYPAPAQKSCAIS